MLVDRLLHSIWHGGEEADEAALTLGLLIEREKTHHPTPNDDGGIKQTLGEQFTNQRLTNNEVRIATDELIKYVSEVNVPHYRAVWALTKCYDLRSLPHLISLLDRFSKDPKQEDLAYYALVGIITFHNEESLEAIKRAAELGQGKVKNTANTYLNLFEDRRNSKK